MQRAGFDTKRSAGILIVTVLFFLYPLFMTNGYYNVTVSKEGFFGGVAILSFFWLYGNSYMERVKREKGFSMRKFGDIWGDMAVTDRFMAGFVLASLLAFLFAKYRDVAFSGCTDSYQGFYFALLLAMLYCVVRKMEVATKNWIYIMTAGMDVTVLLALWQFLGGDPFGLFVGLEEKTDYVSNYLSTLGNTAVFGLYLTLLVPVAGYAYCKIEKTAGRVFLAASSLLGVMGVLCSNTDATYLGFLCSIAFLAMTLTKKSGTCRRFLELLGIYGIGGALFSVIYRNCENARTLSTIVKKIVEISAGKWAVLFIGIGICWALCFFSRKKEKAYRILQKGICALVIGAAAAVLFAFLYFSIWDRQTKLGGLESYLRFDLEWGTERGYVWSWLASIFADAGIVQKLFGAGQGSVVFELFTYYRTEMVEGLGYFFDNAHNVYLHYLTTMGLNGCIMYLGLLFSALWQGFFGVEEEHSYGKGFAVAAAAYAAQGFFSILEPITVPILIFYLALLQNEKLAGVGKNNE